MSWGWQRYQVERARPELVPDGRGNEVPDWESAWETSSPVGAWLWAPATPVEDLDGRVQGVQVAGDLYGPAVVDVEAGDGVEFDVGRFKIIGEPQRWRPGTVLKLERWDG